MNHVNTLNHVPIIYILIFLRFNFLYLSLKFFKGLKNGALFLIIKIKDDILEVKHYISELSFINDLEYKYIYNIKYKKKKKIIK